MKTASPRCCSNVHGSTPGRKNSWLQNPHKKVINESIISYQILALVAFYASHLYKGSGHELDESPEVKER